MTSCGASGPIWSFSTFQFVFLQEKASSNTFARTKLRYCCEFFAQIDIVQSRQPKQKIGDLANASTPHVVLSPHTFSEGLIRGGMRWLCEAVPLNFAIC